MNIIAPLTEPVYIGWKHNEILMYWKGEYWRWTASPQTKDAPTHLFEPLTDEHKQGWHL